VIAGTQFVVAYRPGRGQVDVLAVFHAARRWPEEF
jgi:plasmid stabilization system protein ParE